MPKCSYCGNEAKEKMVLNTYDGLSKTNLEFYYCSDEHKKEIEDFSGYVNKNASKFIISVILDMIVLTIAVPLGFALKNAYINLAFSVVPLVILGLLIYKYPFATPDTNRKHGIKKAVKITKTIGKVIVIGALLIGITILCYILLSK